MILTKPSIALPRLIAGKRNRNSLKTFQSAHVYTGEWSKRFAQKKKEIKRNPLPKIE
jgi:hypothetical protein